MLPNHYEVEEVSRIRREEAAQQAARDRLSHEPKGQGSHSARRAGGASFFGGLRQRITVLFKRGERRSARVTANQLPITNDFH